MNHGLSLIRLSKAGAAPYVGAQIKEEVEASIQGITSFKLDPEVRGRKVSSEDDRVLIRVMKAAVGDDSADLAATVSIWNGKFTDYITRARESEHVLNRYGDYIPVLEEWGLSHDETPWGQQVNYKQPESIEELAQRLNGLTRVEGESVAWPGLLGVLDQYYGKGTAPGEEESFRSVIPFVLGTDNKPYFGEEGQLIELNSRGLVAVDYGVTVGAVMLDLVDQAFPNASVPWRVSRAFINMDKYKSIVGVLSHARGVVDNYSDNDAHADVFAAGIRPESQSLNL